MSVYANFPDGNDVVDLTQVQSDIAELKEKKLEEKDLADYAKSTDVTKTLEDYVKSDDLESTLGDYLQEDDLADYAKSSDVAKSLEDYVKTEDAEKTYAKKSDVASAVRWVGSVAKATDLDDKKATASVGDLYNVEEDGMNYVWNGTEFDAFAPNYDFSQYAKKSDLNDYVKDDELAEKIEDALDDSDKLDEILGDYATTEDLSEYAKTADVDKTYAKKAEIPTDYLTDDDISDFVTQEDIDDSIKGKADKTDLLVKKSAEVSATVAGWTGESAPYEQTISISGLGAEDVVFISYDSTQKAEFAKADCAYVNKSQAAGSFKIQCQNKPSVALNMTVEYLTKYTD